MISSSIAWVKVCVKSEKKHEGGMGDFFLAQGAPPHLSPLFSPDLCLLHHLGRIHLNRFCSLNHDNFIDIFLFCCEHPSNSKGLIIEFLVSTVVHAVEFMLWPWWIYLVSFFFDKVCEF